MANRGIKQESLFNQSMNFHKTNAMALLTIIFLVLGTASFFCIVLFAAFYSSIYCRYAFSRNAPRVFGKDAASTDEIVAYYCTRVFLTSLVGLVSIYLFYLLKG